MSILLLMGIFLVLLALEVPVAFAMIFSALVFILTGPGLPDTIVIQRMTGGLDSFPLLAIPLFVLAGHLFNRAGISERIFDFASAFAGHMRGGLAQVNIAASIIFAGMSGVAQADAAGLGAVEIRQMRERGYSAGFSAAVTAASSIIGPIIPPSVIMVIYAVTAQVSLTDLFLAGIVPGLLMGLSLMIMVNILVRFGFEQAPRSSRASLSHLTGTFWKALPALIAPVLLVAGMLTGVATPTELGALIVVYAAVLGFVNRELTFRGLLDTLAMSAVTTGVLVFIIAAAFPFGWLISVQNLPGILVTFMRSLTEDPVMLLLILNIALLIAGLFMETTAIILVATPALLPLVLSYGIDPVHFGVVMIINLLIGALTPPFGVILFICKHIAQVSFGQMIRSILPFYIPLLVVLLLLTYCPQLVLWLPGLFR
ncbi:MULTISPECIES: TRAP transporter large permease [Sinorhizobium]|uniref:TRAP transporter large permease n=1 Tax=Sinorhizobium TaxID=28105 RepID=UPI0023D8AD69|nr:MULTISPECIES: TRAP transporter large permease [unclassified Sinorhizobium]WEJ13047.1 TRAP transporter large permease [Sinorhizobium sp. M103]WEJ18130.1 TRAP transporter large permease [Sinorhizobium sp. K101]WEJ39921.1 TRAP transporter large permease [Sinorhizobium sp. C101]